MCKQVADVIQGTPAAICTVPHLLLQKLIGCSAIIASLRSQISGTPYFDSGGTKPAWTATVGALMNTPPPSANSQPVSQVSSWLFHLQDESCHVVEIVNQDKNLSFNTRIEYQEAGLVRKDLSLLA